MGEPTAPGEDQETRIFIEGPASDATPVQVAAFNAEFERFKQEMTGVLKKYNSTLKSRLRGIEYIKKDA